MRLTPLIRLLVLVPALIAASVTDVARASAQLDRQFALERVAFLKAWDNVDGLFVPYVEGAYTSYFKDGTRFQLMDAAKAADVLLNSRLPYRELIEDKAILAQVARAVKAESIIRTKVFKEGPRYRFTIDWLHTPKMTLIATHQFSIEHRSEDQGLSPAEIEHELAKALGALIARLPFEAHVTGRDREWVTINSGADSSISKGDTLVISTLEEVKVHPILGSIVDWRMEKAGTAIVDNIDGGVIFAKVLEEEPGRQISRYQKIVKVIKPKGDPVDAITEVEYNPSPNRMFDVPRLGWFSAGPWVGGSSRQFGDGSRTVGGSGFFFGGLVEGQIWFNREFFLDAGFGHGFNSYSQEDIGGAGGNLVEADQSTTKWRIGLGYTYLLTGDFYGPKGWLKFGFQTTSHSLPSSSGDLTGPASFGGVYFGVGGDLPIRGHWGAIFEFEIGLFNGVSASGFTVADGEGVSSMHFFLGGYYRLTPRLAFRGGLDVQANATEFGPGVELTHRVISLVPSIVYSF